MKLKWICFIVCLCSLSAQGSKAQFPIKEMISADAWIAQESQIAAQKLEANIAPAGTVAGVVVASPQTQNPNYFRHWVRDAAISMNAIAGLRERADRAGQIHYDQLLTNYTVFSRSNQLAQTLVDLGEPIFEVNGEPFRGPWGRPQNDGPALRAIALMHWAQILLDEGKQDFVRTWLYSSNLPASTVIKADLEYVSHHWQDSSFDLWEEVRGDHFFTRMVQRKALVLGAQLADRLGDPSAAQWYRAQSRKLEKAIETHWDDSRQLIQATVHWVEGASYKYSGLDVAVLLGVLHGSINGFFDVSDPRVVATFEKLVKTFSDLYPINQYHQGVAPALGRYPEDIYAGSDFSGGNPWVLATLAGAQVCYLAAQQVSERNPTLAKKMLAHGDEFFQRVQLHANPDGSLSEQIQRNNGYMISARDLTWNYAAVLTAAWARQQTLNLLRNKH